MQIELAGIEGLGFLRVGLVHGKLMIHLNEYETLC